MKFNNTFNIFETPIWYIEKDLPEGVYEWALDMERNVKGTQLSNRGGYQSEWLDIPNFKYLDHLRSMMVFLPEFHFSNMWVNINRKGDYNWRHTHPGSDLACIWYITENLNKLVLEDHILMNADVIYPPELITRINDSKHETVLAVDIKKCGREEVKVIEGANQKIKAIGKELIEEQCLGEFLGVAKFSKDFNVLFSNSLTKLIDAGGKSDYFEAGIEPLLKEVDVYYSDVSDLPCLEIDFIEDLSLIHISEPTRPY